MFAYVVRRVLSTVPVMAVVALFVFALLHLSPGDPAAIIAGDTATPADIARIHQALDDPAANAEGECDFLFRLDLPRQDDCPAQTDLFDHDGADGTRGRRLLGDLALAARERHDERGRNDSREQQMGQMPGAG